LIRAFALLFPSNRRLIFEHALHLFVTLVIAPHVFAFAVFKAGKGFFSRSRCNFVIEMRLVSCFNPKLPGAFHEKFLLSKPVVGPRELRRGIDNTLAGPGRFQQVNGIRFHPADH